MDVTPLVKSGQQIIQSYAHGGFLVSGARYEGAVIVTPGAVRGWGFAGEARALAETDFTPLSAQAREIDVVLLGTGARMALPPAALKTALKAQGLSVEAMDTGAACRTYNVLMAEGRRVAAALLPV